ncbi:MULTISPECIES: acyl-CoA dehydrogenase family protein [unclassified Sphingomonas]|uniref:acyl-CoA dehydrogenase family protein n=1 Tax=unclassified Sphingomonas TaxID=196159 RepID=UPI0006FDDB0B|nr:MULTISPECIES: acyl-CoA dehydrogenase family protein [unclassified Sphingomonas]KQX18589.1 acyl-CoA dehydrogenase [Sphingomonas sp. Root1294]KQY72087.1 acyl-CoA dehydrogenase [Sphingomonas sp. Root50]KRB94643.1 acyl-CoA dehydrogenase [Sphingomonas sp. Root720]
MPLLLDDEQIMLREMAGGFLADHSSPADVRALRDGGDPPGFTPPFWRQLARQGLLGVLIAETHGGLGLGHVDAGIVLEQMGRNLSMSPYLSSAVLAPELLGPSRHAEQWLPKIARGDAVVAFAFEEFSKHRREIGLRAERSADGYRLSGCKRCVLHGHVADLLIVAARTSGTASDHDGLSLFAVPGGALSLICTPVRLVDSGIAADIAFERVMIGHDSLIGEEDQAIGPIVRLLNVGAAAAAAELLGVAEGAQALTLAFLKERRQFDVPIGSFQALQHRAAHLYAEIEVARSAVLKAQQALDDRSPETSIAVSVAKAMAGNAAMLAVKEGVQMHGGVGMTDAYDIGLYMKRARTLAELFGDAAFHADLIAKRRGY